MECAKDQPDQQWTLNEHKQLVHKGSELCLQVSCEKMCEKMGEQRCEQVSERMCEQVFEQVSE